MSPLRSLRLNMALGYDCTIPDLLSSVCSLAVRSFTPMQLYILPTFYLLLLPWRFPSRMKRKSKSTFLLVRFNDSRSKGSRLSLPPPPQHHCRYDTLILLFFHITVTLSFLGKWMTWVGLGFFCFCSAYGGVRDEGRITLSRWRCFCFACASPHKDTFAAGLA